MKKVFVSILVLAAALICLPCAVSCKKPEADPQQKEEPGKKDEPEQPEGPQAGTYTFTASPMKGEWKAGDKIYVHGSYGPAAKTITLAASDISADGKKATVNLEGVFEFVMKPDYLYAAWPAEAVAENDGVMAQSTEFKVFDQLLSVAFLKENDFAFVDAVSCVKFKVSGFTDFAFAGNQRPGLRITSYTANVTSDEENFMGRKDDGYPYLYGKIANGEVTMWIPGTVTLKDGLTIYFGNGNEWTKSYSTSETLKLKAGDCKDLGDISGNLAAYDGPAPKMPEIGKRTKYTVAVEELSGLCLSADKDFMWTVGDEGHLGKIDFDGKVVPGSIIRIGGDCEAVTLDPVTKNLIIGTEPNTVYKVDYPAYDKKVKLFSIEDAAKYGNAGQEGITYYKDGLIYSGMQTSSELYCIELETGKVVWKKNLRQIFPSITEIADLEYDPLTDWLWIVDSEAKKLTALTGDAERILGAYLVKTPANPESLCVDHEHSCIWVGDDYGSTSYLYKYEFTGLDDAIINK